MDKDRLVQTFLDLVRIPSPGLHEGAVAAYIKEKGGSLGLEDAERRRLEKEMQNDKDRKKGSNT